MKPIKFEKSGFGHSVYHAKDGSDKLSGDYYPAPEVDALVNNLSSMANEFCSCGGGDPETGCDVCKYYHLIRQALAPFVD